MAIRPKRIKSSDDDVAVHQILDDSSNDDLNSLSDFDNADEDKPYNHEISSDSNEKSGK